jgi:hypothetical protein
LPSERPNWPCIGKCRATALDAFEVASGRKQRLGGAALTRTVYLYGSQIIEFIVGDTAVVSFCACDEAVATGR